MDVRIRKTRKGIQETFLELRARKPLEKITVTELCRMAQINKSTFYTHYRDIYALADAVEKETVETTLQNVKDLSLILRQPQTFARELFEAFIANEKQLRILFSGSRSILFVQRVEESVAQSVFALYPALRSSGDFRAGLRYCIYGSFYAFERTPSLERPELIDLIGELNALVVQKIDPKQIRDICLHSHDLPAMPYIRKGTEQ